MLGIIFGIIVAPVHAQSACGKRVDIVKMLASKYKEAPRVLAISGQSNLLEAYVSPLGSWTILITNPQGLACIVAAGESWENVPLAAVGLPL